MRKTITLAAAILSAAFAASAQDVYKIYDGVAPGAEGLNYPEMTLCLGSPRPRVYNVTEPTITVYRPEEAVNTGTAVIIAPGGGNMYLTWEEEGVNVAQWFQRHGITGIILKYRTNFMGNTEKEIEEQQNAFFQRMFGSFAEMGREVERGGAQAPVRAQRPAAPATPQKVERTIQGDDGRQAVKYVRAHAEELGVNPDKIGLIGFSAGGSLTCNVMYINDEETRPNLAGPIYGVFSNGELPQNPVPTFIAAPEFDLGAPDASFNLYKKFQEAHLPAELHFIHDATHGEGLLYNGREWNEWIDLLYAFMKAVKFVE